MEAQADSFIVIMAAELLKAQVTVSVGFHLVFICIPGEFEKEALSKAKHGWE